MKKWIKRMSFLIVGILLLVSICFNILYYLYPKKYEEQVLKYSKEYELSPYLIWGIIRTESNYNPNAKSVKDAMGLMQIRPNTGEWIAKRLDIKEYNQEKLYDVDINIKMGCWYIKSLIEQYNNIDTALAAYNAGSGNVDKWLRDEDLSDNGRVLINIPFQETKKYVEKIKINRKIYEILY